VKFVNGAHILSLSVGALPNQRGIGKVAKELKVTSLRPIPKNIAGPTYPPVRVFYDPGGTRVIPPQFEFV